jgi:hypothetical protein
VVVFGAAVLPLLLDSKVIGFEVRTKQAGEMLCR